VDEEDVKKSRMTKATKKVAEEVDKVFVKEKKQKLKMANDDDEELVFVGNGNRGKY